MKNVAVLLFLAALLAPAVSHNIMIDINELPLVIDTYARYGQNSSVFRWTAFDSTRTHWDLTGYPRTLTTRMGLRDYEQGIIPAPESMAVDFPEPDVVEFDTLGNGTEQTAYHYLDSFALWTDGIDFEQIGYRFIGNYIPDGETYQLPMYYGGSWITEWTWQYEILPGVPYVANEQHEKWIAARGKVKVPMSGDYYWPCLVIKDHMTFSDNAGSTDLRWIYEWVVPGHFAGGNGVAAAMSQNGAAPNFINVQNLFQLQSCDVPGWDLVPPTFANTTVWRDTIYSGPFVVATDIEDDDEVGDESLCYRVNQGAWQSVESDSDNGLTYWYTIPQVDPPARIDYFVWARDEFCELEDIEFWTTWPVCSPESTMITFVAGGQPVEEQRPLQPGEASLTAAPSPFSRCATIRLSHPYAAGGACRIYSTAGRLVRTLVLAPEGSGTLSATWDGRNDFGRLLPAGPYVYRVTAPGWTGSGRLLLAR